MALFQIHHRNIQSLATEIYKFPAIMGDVIKLYRPPTCNLRTRQELYSRKPKNVRYGTYRKHIFFGSEILGNSSPKYKKPHLLHY